MDAVLLHLDYSSEVIKKQTGSDKDTLNKFRCVVLKDECN